MNIDLGGNTLVNGYFAGIVVGCGSGQRWGVVSSSCTASAGERLQADTSAGSFTVTLPGAASIGSPIRIQDAKLTWNTHNLTIAGNGAKINGGTSNYIASVVGDKLLIVYIRSQIAASYRIQSAAVE